MEFCRSCGASVHDSALKCPQCDAPHKSFKEPTLTEQSGVWVPILSVIFGAVSMSGIQYGTKESIEGGMLFAILGAVLGWAGIKNSSAKGFSIVGVILSGITIVATLGLLIK